MNHLSLIIKREYLTKVKNKAFIIMTFLSPIIMIGLISVVAYLAEMNNSKVREISVLDQSGLLQDYFKDSENIKYTILNNLTLENAKTIVQDKKDYGLLYIGKIESIDNTISTVRFYSADSPSFSVISELESKIERELTSINRKNKGINISEINASKVTVNVAQESFIGEKTSKIDSGVKIVFGVAAGYLLFMFIIIYGNMIMRSIIEEKTSRIIEVIISSVKPVQLMLGKIIGTSLVGITQVALWIIFGSILMVVASLIFGIDLLQVQLPEQELMQEAIRNSDKGIEKLQQFLNAFLNLPLINLIVAFILFFISGYLLYSSLYAAIGAAVDNETDTQQFMMPIILPLILAVYVGGFTVVEDPHGAVSTLFSFIPFTSPVVMLMRIPFGVPLWQQLVSLLILIGTFMFTVWFAAKIYRVGILMYGKKPTYRELVKWMKY